MCKLKSQAETEGSPKGGVIEVQLLVAYNILGKKITFTIIGMIVWSHVILHYPLRNGMPYSLE